MVTSSSMGVKVLGKGDNMLNEYKTVYQGNTAEIVEKKSRFIASVFPVSSEEQALQHIEQIRKQNWNASHNCFAYVIGENFSLQRCSDDGEPSGTAGRPMLEVLLGEEIHDTLVIVTRYFGGTLLGTGGLVRAYGGAVKAGLAASNIITKKYGCKLSIATDYNGLGKIQYILGQRGLTILESEYSDVVDLEVLVPVREEAGVTAEIIEKTNGQAKITRGDECYFADISGEMVVF